MIRDTEFTIGNEAAGFGSILVRSHERGFTLWIDAIGSEPVEAYIELSPEQAHKLKVAISDYCLRCDRPNLSGELGWDYVNDPGGFVCPDC